MLIVAKCERTSCYHRSWYPCSVSPPKRRNTLLFLTSKITAQPRRAALLLPGAYFPSIVQPLYLFFTDGLGLHSSPLTGCIMTLFGYWGVLLEYPLLQS
jgi:hypothetical protein